MNFRNRRILLLGAIGLLVCTAAVWRRATAQPVLAFPALNHTGTQSASLDFGGRHRRQNTSAARLRPAWRHPECR